ncbi:MAG: exodeoxyribonuclease III [Rhizobiales bacterium 24-66-13]|nr:MAG: exodeoxyribonuclease III [Rhizobiales bacterium 35-66-30]OYZ73059.1 MAG: exodeoxyribonuclease III [Rhizobiales bacterium 24-66-13]HQS09869.1 exodeoxyribonuclease III [Xanthobacteraceae bacterium]HQS45700.1 exodeoxyribonuclease III [Xanthobacteraceae bacterium]
MSLTVCTWNINSIRIRLDLVKAMVERLKPDVLCLQETKCQDDKFPLAAVRELGFPHIALNGQKGWHGVATLSRLPFEAIERQEFCAKGDARHIAVTLGVSAGLSAPVTVHNFYVPAGGDIPDPELNEKFAHKLAFLDELTAWERLPQQVNAKDGHAVLVGDLNIAPLETDVWGHKQLLGVVSHTPVEVERLNALQASGPWVDVMRRFVPPQEKLFTWWSYRSPDWTVNDRGRRLDHVWTSPGLAPHASAMTVLREARNWERPSDHVPVAVTFEV